METLVTLVVTGTNAPAVERALRALDGKLEPVGQSRGAGEALKGVLKWILKFTGDASKVVDQLLEQVDLAGASLEVEFKGMKVKVTNANRSQILELLREAQRGAAAAADL